MDLQFDRFPVRNRCGAAAIAIASLLERLALAELGFDDTKRTFRTWEDVLVHIRRNTEPFRTSGRSRPMSDFLETDRTKRISLTDRNPDSHQRLEEGIKVVFEGYLETDRPISSLLEGGSASSPATYEFVRAVVGQMRLLCEKGLFANIFKNVRPEQFPEKIADIVAGWFAQDYNQPRHPCFSSLPIFDPLLARSEFVDIFRDKNVGVDEDVGVSSFGLYAVMREIRGLSAREIHESNLIVRDILWIRPTHSPARTLNKVKQSTEYPDGIYYSVNDHQCFLISQVDIEDQSIYLSGRAIYPGRNSRRMTLNFTASAFSHPLQIRDGLLSASTRDDGNLGAWKLLLIRPNWSFTVQLETILAQLTIGDTGKIPPLCTGSGVAAALSQNDDRGLLEPQEAFLKLIFGESETELRPLGETLKKFLI